ncbi:MAG TPA: tetratricopeptide repeat protein, partial [Bacteroidetes bacterium]|nr:tetratricopeptide repeat protein [Bacteroidota bacterium]
LDELRSKWIVEGKPPLYSRIGVNTGDVIVGNMGSRDLFDYTVLGDAVNLCSRLENANKIYKTNILISQSTRDELPDGYVTRALGDLRVRGRVESVRLHELIAAHKSHLPPDKQRLLELYQQGWSHFESRKWAEAADCFEQALDLDPQDHPARMLLARSRHFESNPPKDEWNGVFTFEER